MFIRLWQGLYWNNELKAGRLEKHVEREMSIRNKIRPTSYILLNRKRNGNILENLRIQLSHLYEIIKQIRNKLRIERKINII
jgi:hypothetical protein